MSLSIETEVEIALYLDAELDAKVSGGVFG
jgi:hypothetical protein